MKPDKPRILTINGALLEQLENTRSSIEDLDYAEAASRLSQQSVTLQAAQHIGHVRTKHATVGVQFVDDYEF